MDIQYDKIIIGAGLYGLYAAAVCGKKGEKILVLEHDAAPFSRATYINQARVHMGYHYPRSYATAVKSAHYFNRFNEDYRFCINASFAQIYATSAAFSWTNARQFQVFCDAAGIKCEPVSSQRYFQPGMCDGAFLTEEYTYDAMLLRDHFLAELRRCPQVSVECGARIHRICRRDTHFIVEMADGCRLAADFILNAAYASTNQILDRCEADIAQPAFNIKYELCEIILCKASAALQDTGITVMDGPFFSIMPFGKTGMHSLTSVTFTPHLTSYERLPRFSCQAKSQGRCTPQQLANCDACPARPPSAWPYMSQMARKYLRPDLGFQYLKSMFSMKPILQASEIDDSRPTVIRGVGEGPQLISVLSGKINTVYDLDEVLMK